MREMNSSLKVYVGYDDRLSVPFDVCVSSIRRRSNVEVVKLDKSLIPEYRRERDPLQSTDFTYTRFLVPYLNGYSGMALFVDCDFVFTVSPTEVLREADSLAKAVSVVQHPDYAPKTDVKMDGKHQASYRRKNWSSFMLFDCGHPAHKALTPDLVNNASGSYLHQFKWLYDGDIGSLPLDWNCLDGYYHLSDPKAIHYTDGGPWFGPQYSDTRYSWLWKREYTEMISDPV